MPRDTASQPLFTTFRARPNVRDEIRETLRAAVISGKLRPGHVFSAPSLAQEFGVSVTPVREALLDLVREGHVEAVRNRGFRVIELSPAQLDHITEVRILLEVPAVRMAASAGAEPAVTDRLLALADAIVEAAQRKDLIAYVTADIEFHLAVIALAGNPELVELVRSLRAKSRIYGLQTLAETGRLLPSSREHAELVRLIEAGDPDGAEHLMRQHLAHVRGIWAHEAGTGQDGGRSATA
jgi:DNA-binding GntR family transcriptional regulator